MQDVLLKGAVNAQNAAIRSMERARRVVKGESREAGDIVQTVIIIGIFVVICVIVGGLITNAMKTQGNKLSQCITNVNTTTGCSQFSK